MFNNLYVGYNVKEDFRIAIVAESIEEAVDKAAQYGCDARLSGSFAVVEADDIDFSRHFDCDYIIY